MLRRTLYLIYVDPIPSHWYSIFIRLYRLHSTLSTSFDFVDFIRLYRLHSTSFDFIHSIQLYSTLFDYIHWYVFTGVRVVLVRIH